MRPRAAADAVHGTELWTSDGTSAGTQLVNRDGNSDMWRNTNGSLVEWQMNGANIASSAPITLGGVPVTPNAT